MGFGLSYSSLPVSSPLTIFTNQFLLKLHCETSGSDQLLGKSQRSLNRFPLKIAPSVEDVGGLCSLFRPDLEDCPQMLSVEETSRLNVFSGVCLLRYTLRCILRLMDLASFSHRLTPSTLKRAHQISPFPIPPIYFHRRFWSPPMLASMPHHPAKPLSTPIFILPPVSRHFLFDRSKKKLGIMLLGWSHFGPLVFPSWAFFPSGGPSPTTNRPWSDSFIQVVNPLMLLSDFKSAFGRGLLLWFLSTVVHDEIDHHYTSLNPAIIRLAQNSQQNQSYPVLRFSVINGRGLCFYRDSTMRLYFCGNLLQTLSSSSFVTYPPFALTRQMQFWREISWLYSNLMS